MSGSLVGRMVLKDLYLVRWVVLGALVLGAATLAMLPLGLVAFYVGSVSYICVLILLNVFVVMGTVAQEKKDKVQLFVLSLPISTAQYTVSKMTSSLIAYFVPFLLTGIGCVLLVRLTPIPDGLLPLATIVAVYVSAYFCVFLAVALAADSAFWNGAVIVLGNISINFFIAWAIRLPSVGPNLDKEVEVWSRQVLAILAIELAVCVLALVAGFYLSLRKKDFV